MFLFSFYQFGVKFYIFFLAMALTVLRKSFKLKQNVNIIRCKESSSLSIRKHGDKY